MFKEIGLFPKQFSVLETNSSEILYGGAAGSGKSMLARVLAITYAIQIPYLQIYFFRRHYADLIKNHMEGESGFRALLADFPQTFVDIIKLEIRFANGSKIFLNSCQHHEDVYKFQGAEIHFLVIEEATQFSENMIRFLRSRVRMSEAMKNTLPCELNKKFPLILYTANPGGIGHHYFKSQFVDKGSEPYRADDSEGGFLRQFIPARLNDNPALDPVVYAQTLKGLKSPTLVKAMLQGDWNVAVGAFFTEFSEKHIIPEVIIPDHLFTFGAFDWGYAAPAAFLFLAVSDGQTIQTKSGGLLNIPHGSLICYKEIYFSSDTNKGASLSNEQMIKILLSHKADNLNYVVTDSLPFQARGTLTIAEEYRKNNIKLVRGDDSRIPGWAQVRFRLIGTESIPRLFFTRSCQHLIRTLPLLQIDSDNLEDIDTNQEDHLADALRLACMTKPLIKTKKIETDILSVPTFSSIVKENVRLQKQREAR